ncbi:GNAT family N-acetyltransferase [Ciceribacter sp. RN22]|uniref:GNAT family N-acetyltransferase n=1 Tax=Ciceribacter sp. RN22 TaxID=2954932 RepID=UPI00209363DE|nr:GNAT family N-acetyltransferase [Ciceribacter sp. RN22]MCO6180903.1 GNAT family N-acetyltransferase [Ciceribacter sp. RN22]
MKTTVRTGTAADFEPACDTLVEAFFNDPFIGYMFPDPARRAQFLPAYFSVYCAGSELLIARTDTADYAGVAVKFTPESLDLSPERAAADREAVFGSCGHDAPTVIRGMTALADGHPHHPAHIYVLFLGVRPEGRGAGIVLLNHVMDICDQAGLHLYGEATTTRIRGFYRRITNGVVRPPVRLDNGQELYPLMRAPQPGSGDGLGGPAQP